MSLKTIVFPQRYVQGPNAIEQIGEQMEMLGIRNPLIVGGPTALRYCQQLIQNSIDNKGMKCSFLAFGGETSWQEIGKIKKACQSGKHDAILSCGGGKVMDAGRVAAAPIGVNAGVHPPEVMPGVGAGVPCVQIPTIASTDAATAKLSVIYTEKGEFETFMLFATNPTMVFVDTEIIANAPVEQLVSGMGDALATYFEADVSYRTSTPTLAGGLCSPTALALAKLAFDTLMENGKKAKTEAEQKIAGPALEAVVEANILLSGLGYENGGLSAAHAIAQNFTRVHHLFDKQPSHGQLVCFSTLTQLMLENRDKDILDQVYGFCESIGLPTTFDELGMVSVSDDDLNMVAEDASRLFLICSLPDARKAPDEEGRFYDPARILDCLKRADAHGHALQSGTAR